jgi:hypothetical protein
MLAYFAGLKPPLVVLWCYLLWYLSTVARYFDASLHLWLNSIGISAIIGTGLYLSTAYGGLRPSALGRWQVFRLYLMPFCVSSFASLIKGQGFVLVFSPSARDNALSLAVLLTFCIFVGAAKRYARRVSIAVPPP